MDFTLAPTHPESQLALPDSPAACPRHLVAISRLWSQRLQCKAYLFSASSLLPGLASRQCPQFLRKRVMVLYVHSVSFWSLSQILALFSWGVGGTTLWRNVQVVALRLSGSRSTGAAGSNARRSAVCRGYQLTTTRLRSGPASLEPGPAAEARRVYAEHRGTAHPAHSDHPRHQQPAGRLIGCLPLRAPDGVRHGLNRSRKPACTEIANDGPEPISTRLKQCRPQARRLSTKRSNNSGAS